MIADGLTKVLGAQKHQVFVKKMGLVDIKGELESRETRELDDDFFDRLEDTLDGGESSIGCK
jgi:hypothetical protein